MSSEHERQDRGIVVFSLKPEYNKESVKQLIHQSIAAHFGEQAGMDRRFHGPLKEDEFAILVSGMGMSEDAAFADVADYLRGRTEVDVSSIKPYVWPSAPTTGDGTASNVN